MSKRKLARALIGLIIALWSATAVIAIKINLAVAVFCLAIVLLNTLWDTSVRHRPRPGEFRV